ncbi:MAG: DUF58 domain-containing protein [Blastocatellia bacterium]
MPTISASGRSRYSLQVLPAGMLFSILAMLVTLLALSSGNNLLYLLVSVLLATGIFSLFASRLILSRIDVRLRHPSGVRTGEEAIFDLTIRNRRGLFPVISQSINLVESRPGSRKSQLLTLGYLPILPGRTEAEVSIGRRFRRRGLYRFSALRLETRFPFGILEHRRRMAIDGELIVYPAPRPLADFIELLPLEYGREESRQKGSGSDLYGIRQSLRTDHHQRVDWKATARTGQLMVREHARDDDWRVTIVFRVQGPDGARPDGASLNDEKYEAAIVLAASLADNLIGEGAAVRLIISGHREGSVIPFASGQAQLLSILDLLARLPVSKDALVASRLHRTLQKLHRHRLHPSELPRQGNIERQSDIEKILKPNDGLVILIGPSQSGQPELKIVDSSETVSQNRVHFISYDRVPAEFADSGVIRKGSER